jgi:AcrR family transcriptional regulator
MENTKERILLASLRLFATDGFEATSMRAIAEQLGITKGALYKHYEGKQEIFDNIVKRMRLKDAENTAAFGVPARRATPEQIKSFSLAMFRYWTEDEFASSFRRMLTLEQYRNPAMAALLNQYLMGGVVGYAEDLIHGAATGKKSHAKDPKILALEYFAPIYLMMNLYDNMDGKEDAARMVEQHIDYLFETLGR